MVGAVLFIPFSYYLNGSPGSYRIPILLPAFLAVLWVAGVALSYQVR